MPENNGKVGCSLPPLSPPTVILYREYANSVLNITYYLLYNRTKISYRFPSSTKGSDAHRDCLEVFLATTIRWRRELCRLHPCSTGVKDEPHTDLPDTLLPFNNTRLLTLFFLQQFGIPAQSFEVAMAFHKTTRGVLVTVKSQCIWGGRRFRLLQVAKMRRPFNLTALTARPKPRRSSLRVRC